VSSCICGIIRVDATFIIRNWIVKLVELYFAANAPEYVVFAFCAWVPLVHFDAFRCLSVPFDTLGELSKKNVSVVCSVKSLRSYVVC
jgi:hypothetical protein